jgi:glycosyltransferase involved in cell wall biosynthesis
MKIAIVSCGLLDSLLPLLRRLSKRAEIDLYVSVYGQQFTESVASFDLSDLPDGLISEEKSRKIAGQKLIDYVEGEGGRIRWRFFKYPTLKVFSAANFRLHRKFADQINGQGYDLVHLNGYRGALMFLYAMLHKKTPRVWSIHDPILHSGEDKWQTRLAYSSFGWLNAHFILHNEGQRPEFMQRYRVKADHCHYVRFGPLDIFRIFTNGHESLPDGSVLFYGRISPYKGVENLIEATRIARKKIPGLKVIIAGKPNYAIDLDSFRDDPAFEIKDHFIENEDMVRMIEASDYVVCPYTDATQSGVVMTAYAFEKPVLATSVGGLPEVVEDGVTGRLVPPKNSQALADAMVAMSSDRNMLEKMKTSLQEKFYSGPGSWEGIAARTMDIYHLAIQKERASPLKKVSH